MSQQPLASTKPVTRCSPRELKRLKVAMGIVILVCVFVLAMAITFGNHPRPFVDRMNLLLAPLVLGSLIVCGHTLWRFRRACAADGESPGG